jgi:chromosomal replication initiator protein
LIAAVNQELEQIWARVQAELATAVDEPTYRVWLEPLRARELTLDSLTLEASPQTCGWIRERFGVLLRSAAETIIGHGVAIIVTDTPRVGRRSRGQDSPTRAPTPTGEQEDQAPELPPCPRHTFDQFVIGDSNRLAHAAALTVAELPGQAYNPLFICGPPGVGKTHLLHSIAALLVDHNPGLTLRITTGERFTNEFQLALGAGRMDGFKSRFRHADVLLIDDVQFLERKVRTEEEFFHTFNALHEAGAQIVLTSDRPPRDLQALEDRLRERFEAGLIADIHPPDFNTRIGVLRKRAHQDRIALADEQVLETIAQRAILNVRALEGALIRIVAYSSLTGRPLTTQLACDVLDSLYPHAAHSPCSIPEIKAAACAHFELTPDELVSPGRVKRIAWPRQVAMYLARELTDESLPAIGRQFGGRDHTTVLHAWRRTTEKIANDSTSRQTVENLRQLIQQQGS